MRFPAYVLAVLGTLATATARAEDWTGAYVGAFASYETASRTMTVPPAYGPSGASFVNGWATGALAGYSWQTGPIVLGAEVDATWSELEPAMTFLAKTSTQAIHVYTEFNAFGSVRARAGYAYGPVLFYGTGGFAWLHGASRLNMTEGMTPNWGPSVAHDYADAFHLGWVLGAGLEWQIRPTLSLRGEWLHYDVGNATDNFTSVGIPTQSSGTVEAFRAAVVQRF